MHISELTTPALLVDHDAFSHNVAVMGELHPGDRLRPHVKAWKSTELARRLAVAGHHGFTCATVAEMEGMARAGLGRDLLLANEVLDARRLGRLVDNQQARVTVAVDSDETITAAVSGGVREVVIDVNVGLPRCGCEPDQAGRLADRARAAGLEVRGVMGYEGHLMHLTDRAKQASEVEKAMAILLAAHEQVGGDLVSGGGTGTFDVNPWVSELQAGSYTLMDLQYEELGLPFELALSLLTTVISVNRSGGWVVLDAGLKALGMDQGNPRAESGEVLFCSDEHTTLVLSPDHPLAVGDRVRLTPAHVDPTVARHPAMHVVDHGEVIDRWAVDLLYW